MKLEESGFGGVFDLNKPDWQGDAHKAFLIKDGVAVLPLSDEFPIFPSQLGSIFYGAYLIAQQEQHKHKYDTFTITFEQNCYGADNYPYIVVRFKDKGWDK